MSGQQIGTGVGFIAGFFLPGGPQVWAGIGGLIGGAISPTQIEGPRLTDGMGVTAQDGVPNPWGFGTFSTGVNVINAFDLREIREEDDGKGSGTEQVTYSYTRSFALGVCRAVRNTDGTYSDIAGIIRVTHNGKDVYNALPDATSEQRANNEKFLEEFTIYLGGETQLPDPTLEAYLGAGNASAYRGQVYIVGTDIDQTDARGAMGTWEVVVAMQGESQGTQWVTVGAAPSLVYMQPSDGITWMEEPYTQFGLAARVMALITPEGVARIINYGADTGYITYSDDGGQTATFVEEWPVNGALYEGTFYNNAVWLPCGNQGYATSPDGVNDWVQYAIDAGAGTRTMSGAGNIMVMAGTVQGAGQGVNARYSSTYGSPGSWSGEFLSLISPLTGNGATVEASDSDGEVIVVGGHDHALAWTSNGFSFTQIDSPFVNGGAGGSDTRVIGRIQFGYDKYGEPLWLAVSFRNDGGTEGQTAWAREAAGPWSLLDVGVYGQSLLDLEYGANQFVGTSGNGLIKVLDDIEVGWVNKPNAWPSNAAINSAAALLQPRTVAPGAISLGDILTEVCRRDGLDATDIDVSQQTQEVKGFKVSTETTGEAIIAALMPGYFFDVAEWDDKIRFVNRGGDPVFDLVVDDLVDRDGPIIEETEVQEVELLRKAIVHTMDPDAGYVETPQSWERRAATVAASGEQTLQLPVVMTRNEARQTAHKRIKVAWTEVRRFLFELPYTRPELTPTDCGTITDRSGRQQRIRLEDMVEDSGIIEIREAKLDRQSAYTSNVTGVQHGQRPTTTPQPPGPTFFWAGNLPSLRTSDNVPGMYISATGYQRGWHGASIFLSTDNGASFQRIMEWPNPSRMGVLTADIDQNDEPIQVFMNYGSLSSITDAQMANRANGFAISSADSDGAVSEIGQFQTATVNSSGDYDLTDVVRGALGTTPASHQIGDPFVMLGTTTFLPIDISHAGKTLIFKAVSYGTTLDETPEYPVVFNPLFTSITISSLTTGGDIITVSGDPIRVVTQNA